MKDLAGLFARIEATLPEGAWCSLDKAQTLAAIVVAHRPALAVELGVWTGDSLIPVLLAMRHIQKGRAIAIDPWSSAASIEGQIDPANVEWWGRADHDKAHARFVDRLNRLEVNDLCHIIRAKSDDVDVAPIGSIGLLHVDANHGENAIRDVDRFAAKVSPGGILVMDDLDWSGKSVRVAYDHAKTLGFTELYALGTGCVMQRRG